MPGYLTDPELKSRLADCLKQRGSASLIGQYDSAVEDSNNFAYNFIEEKLAARGYSAAQIAAWDRGRDFQIALGLFWCFVFGGIPSNWGPDAREWVKELDWRAELDTVTVLNDGEVVEPVDPTTGLGPIGYGNMANDTDRHTLDNDGVIPSRVRSIGSGCYPSR